jgi:hypothetical protein
LVLLSGHLLLVPGIWQDFNAETCVSYVKDSMHKLLNSALVGVAQDFHFIITHRINNVNVLSNATGNTDIKQLATQLNLVPMEQYIHLPYILIM